MPSPCSIVSNSLHLSAADPHGIQRGNFGFSENFVSGVNYRFNLLFGALALNLALEYTSGLVIILQRTKIGHGAKQFFKWRKHPTCKCCKKRQAGCLRHLCFYVAAIYVSDPYHRAGI